MNKKPKFRKAILPLSKAEKEYMEDAFIHQDEPDKIKDKKHHYLMRIPQRDWLILRKISYINNIDIHTICLKAIQKFISEESKMLDNDIST